MVLSISLFVLAVGEPRAPALAFEPAVRTTAKTAAVSTPALGSIEPAPRHPISGN
jgi:hypothetical protein